MRRVACAIGCAALFCLTLEVSARVDDFVRFRAPLLANYSLDDLFVVDEAGFHGRPLARFERWQLNSLGVQGPELPATRSADDLVVLVLGASESFGLYETPGMSYPAQIQAMLARSAGGRVVVLNAAFAGMSLPRAIEFCGERGPRIRPDVVLYYPTPASYLDEEVPSAVARRTPVKQTPSPRIARRIRSLTKKLLPSWALDRLRERELARARQGKPEAWFFHDVPADRVRLFETHLRTLLDCVDHVGARPVLGTHANRFGQELSPQDRSVLMAWQRFYPRADRSVLLEMERRVNQVVRRVSAERGVAFADLEVALPRSGEYFADFSHFTDRGSTLAAAAFAETILNSRARPAGSSDVSH